MILVLRILEKYPLDSLTKKKKANHWLVLMGIKRIKVDMALQYKRMNWKEKIKIIRNISNSNKNFPMAGKNQRAITKEVI